MNDDSDNELGKYFEMDCDNSFSYGNDNQDNDSQNSNNINKNEENNSKNHKSNQIDEYLNNSAYLDNNTNNINIPEATQNINNTYNINNNKLDINKSDIEENNSIIKEKDNYNINKSINLDKNNNNTINNISDGTNINNISLKSNLNSVKIENSNNNSFNIKKIDDNIENLIFPNIENNKDNYINKEPNNQIKIKNLGDTKVIEDVSLSSESNNEIEVISSEEFRRHFQEEKYGPQRTIEVIPATSPKKIPFSQYHDKLKYQKNISKSDNKGFDAFFMDDKKKENKVNKIINQKYNNSYSPKKAPKNKINRKRKKFSPLPKDKYRDNKKFQKLLINRLEKQILTDIYNEYDNKDDFDETYYHLDKLKFLLNEKGLDEAMNYLESIEPENLKRRIINESTFFFKEIVREEVEFAKANGGTLILYKQPDYIFSQNMKYNIPLSGKLNQNNDFVKRGKSIRFNDKRNNIIYNNNEYKKDDYNNFYNSPNVYGPSKNKI